MIYIYIHDIHIYMYKKCNYTHVESTATKSPPYNTFIMFVFMLSQSPRNALANHWSHQLGHSEPGPNGLI